jgi:zinc transporter 9
LTAGVFLCARVVSLCSPRRRIALADAADLPDRIPTEVAEELLKQSEKVKADDDRKRGELDSFWATRSFPRSTMATLYLSLGGNILIAGAKFLAYTRTGHSAMLSEAIHTLVDVVNQMILGYGLREASKAPDKSYQYGYGRAAFFYSLLSALSTFGFGAVFTFAHGVDTLITPPEALATAPETWGVLGIALLVDGFVLTTAWKDVSRRAQLRGVTPIEWILSFRDPFTVAVIFEDSAAVVGVVIAAAGIGMTQLTGVVAWDGAATIAIATLLAGVSLKLVQLNRSFILGRPVDLEVTDAIAQLLLARKSVDAVFDVQSQWIGPQAFSYNADVDFDGTYLAAQIYER